MSQTGATGSRRSDRERPPRRVSGPAQPAALPPRVVAFDPVGEITAQDSRAATRAAMADDFAARFGLEDVESSAEALADRYGFRYEEPATGVPARRTVEITGHGAGRVIPPGREVRRSPRNHGEMIGFRGDRIAMYAVLLGLLLAVAAALSAHAAVLPH
jgi:hypothetical protein